MKFFIYSSILLVILVSILLIYINNSDIKRKIKNTFKNKITTKLIKNEQNGEYQLNKQEKLVIYNYLNEYFNNLIISNDIKLKEEEDYFVNDNFEFYSNDKKVRVKIIFKPIKNNNFITKYNIFNKFGKLEHIILNDFKYDNIVPEIYHLSESSNDIENDTEILTTDDNIKNYI